MSVEIGRVVHEWERQESDPLSAYVQVHATLDGAPIVLSVVVGVPPADREECVARGGYVHPFVATWRAHANDWAAVPSDWHEEVESALWDVMDRLWDEIVAMRETARTIA